MIKDNSNIMEGGFDMTVIGIIALAAFLVCLFVFICKTTDDSHTDEEGFNWKNSSMGVRCDSKADCDLRHTTTCERCQHNHGPKPFTSNFIPKNE